MKHSVFFSLLLLNISIYCQTGVFKCGEELIDSRDNRSYETVQIGSQCWMRQNLNIGELVRDMQQTKNQKIEKTCYQNDEKLCAIMGGLYTWDEAMQYKEGNQGICPEGWRIPSKEDWQTLVSHLGVEEAGQKLKVSEDGALCKWDGTNESGFSALPSGAANHAYFKRKDQWALFWTSTTENNERAWFAQLDSYWYPEPPKYKTLFIGNYYLKTNGFSVRCIKND